MLSLVNKSVAISVILACKFQVWKNIIVFDLFVLNSAIFDELFQQRSPEWTNEHNSDKMTMVPKCSFSLKQCLKILF